MAVDQRDVYLLPWYLDPKEEDHLYIVLSIREANDHESTFVAVPITTSAVFNNDYSFQLSNDMFEEPLKKSNSHARMHLVTLCLNNEIVGKRMNRMKSQYFRQLMKDIGDLVFNYDFTPNP